MDYTHPQGVGQAIARFRKQAGITQSILAENAKLEQSRVSRIEKGEITAPAEIDKALDALALLGVDEAAVFKEYLGKAWRHIKCPSFWNPERQCLENAEETLDQIERFLRDDERPWPLRRQIERHRETLLRAAEFLGRTDHRIAFVGDMGVGKSTAISFAFDLLVPLSLVDQKTNQTVLEAGGGGITICEVHIKAGPEFGLSVAPMSDPEISSLVSDFCAAKWALYRDAAPRPGETVSVSREVERAIRNMSRLVRRSETVDGKRVRHDPVYDLVNRCSSEDELRVQVFGLMSFGNRTQRELWHDSSTHKHPMEWVAETFRDVNNGRQPDVSLPRSIDVIVPEFGRSFDELEISVIDTKGVDDIAVREDLDHRLKEPRTAVVLCSRFNDAPGTTSRTLLEHMQHTFSERVDTGKVSLLVLPRADEARAMKDDTGEQVLTDAEGYEFKKDHVEADLAAKGLSGVPTIFYNVESDGAHDVRQKLYEQLRRMRTSVKNQLVNLREAAQEIITNHEERAMNAAIKEVASRLHSFLKGNPKLEAREQPAHDMALRTIGGSHPSTVWASTRRNGEYTSLNILHLLGVGAARDARLRSQKWFDGLATFRKSLEADDDLAPARHSIAQIEASAETSRRLYLEAVQRSGVEVYRGLLGQAQVWPDCVNEWGDGSGFRKRVADRLDEWFGSNPDPKKKLEWILHQEWDRVVIAPLRLLADESEPDT